MFREFALRSNLIEIAVGFVLGVAFQAVVSSFVEDVLMQAIAARFGWPDFTALAWGPVRRHRGRLHGPVGATGRPLVMLYVDVEDIEEFLAGVERQGGTTLQGRTLISDEIGWWARRPDRGPGHIRTRRGSHGGPVRSRPVALYPTAWDFPCSATFDIWLHRCPTGRSPFCSRI